jgi:hypothetical protein
MDTIDNLDTLIKSQKLTRLFLNNIDDYSEIDTSNSIKDCSDPQLHKRQKRNTTHDNNDDCVSTHTSDDECTILYNHCTESRNDNHSSTHTCDTPNPNSNENNFPHNTKWHSPEAVTTLLLSQYHA